jgi:hypothetical protein
LGEGLETRVSPGRLRFDLMRMVYLLLFRYRSTMRIRVSRSVWIDDYWVILDALRSSWCWHTVATSRVFWRRAMRCGLRYRSTVPSLPLVFARCDRRFWHRCWMMHHLLWCNSCGLLVYRGLLVEHVRLHSLPLAFHRSICGSNIQPRETLVKAGVGRSSRAGRARARIDHHGTSWLSCVRWRRMIEALDARQSCNLARGGLTSECRPLIIGSLVVGQATRSWSLRVVCVCTRVPRASAVLKLRL